MSANVAKAEKIVKIV